MELKDRIRMAMLDKDMKPIDLCRATGMGSSKVSQILNGKVADPRLSTMVKIADALDTSLDYLAGRADHNAVLYPDAETERLAEGFSQLNRDGRMVVLDTVEFQLAKNSKSKQVPDNQVSGVA